MALLRCPVPKSLNREGRKAEYRKGGKFRPGTNSLHEKDFLDKREKGK